MIEENINWMALIKKRKMIEEVVVVVKQVSNRGDKQCASNAMCCNMWHFDVKVNRSVPSSAKWLAKEACNVNMFSQALANLRASDGGKESSSRFSVISSSICAENLSSNKIFWCTSISGDMCCVHRCRITGAKYLISPAFPLNFGVPFFRRNIVNLFMYRYWTLVLCAW